MKTWMVLGLSMAAAGGLSAASVDELKTHCGAFHSGPGFGSFTKCMSDFFTLQPVHPIAKSIVPGGGTGPGLSFTEVKPLGTWNSLYTVNGAISLRKYWSAETMATFRHPKFGKPTRAGDAFASHVYIRARDLPQMAFYGLGPNTSQSNVVDFSERDVFVGADVTNPVSSWLRIGGTLEGIVPDVGGVHQTGVRSIDQFYTEATAPGLAKQPKFIHSEILANPHHADPLEFDYRIGYHFFTDTDTGHYSFRRFQADLKHNIFLERNCNGPCRDRVLTIRGMVSLSDKGSGNAIPFYLQQTLGGSDITGDAMLRGFRDYRFRAPDLFLFETQYERRVWKNLGLLGFYDTGEVALKASDLDFSHLRHSYGFGIAIFAEARVVFRAYVGLGSGEGHHNFFGLAPGLGF